MPRLDCWLSNVLSCQSWCSPLIAPQGAAAAEMGEASMSKPVDQWSPSQPLYPHLVPVGGQVSMAERTDLQEGLGVAGCEIKRNLRKDGGRWGKQRNKEKAG